MTLFKMPEPDIRETCGSNYGANREYEVVGYTAEQHKQALRYVLEQAAVAADVWANARNPHSGGVALTNFAEHIRAMKEQIK
jgi:hypothetical protein